MPYLFCTLKKELIKKHNNAFNQDIYVEKPELVIEPVKSLDIKVLAVVEDLTNVDYEKMGTVIQLHELCPWHTWNQQVLYCFRVEKSATLQSVDLQAHKFCEIQQFTVESIVDVVGCFVYSTYRFSNGRAYCVANQQAEENCRKAFINGAKTFYQMNPNFVTELKVSVAEFIFPKEFILSPSKSNNLNKVINLSSAQKYLDDNLYNNVTQYEDKQTYLDLIKNTFSQISKKHSENDGRDIITELCDLFDYIDEKVRKDKVNLRKNPWYDTIFRKSNTKNWIATIREIRNTAYEKLIEIANEQSPDQPEQQIFFIRSFRDRKLFAEHLDNSIFNIFHETKTVQNIDKQIAIRINK